VTAFTPKAGPGLPPSDNQTMSHVVMCKARLGLKAPAWARLSTAWASQNLKPGRHFGPGSAQAWPGLGHSFSTYSTCHTYSTASMATSYQYITMSEPSSQSDSLSTLYNWSQELSSTPLCPPSSVCTMSNFVASNFPFLPLRWRATGAAAKRTRNGTIHKMGVMGGPIHKDTANKKQSKCERADGCRTYVCMYICLFVWLLDCVAYRMQRQAGREVCAE